MDCDKDKAKTNSNPREKANIFSIFSFLWTIDLFVKGYKRDLKINDLYDTLEVHSASRLENLLERNWHLEIENARRCQREPKLHRALFKVFGSTFLFYGVVVALSDIIYCYGLPMCLAKLVTSFSVPEDGGKANQNQAFLYATGIIVCMLFYCLIWHWYIERVTQTGIRMRVAVSSLLYKKALELESNTLGRETNVGQKINLLSSDSSRFDKSLIFLNHLWVSPFGTVIITYFLWQEIGVGAFIGVAVLLLFVPLHGYLGKKIGQFRRASSISTDQRVGLMNEIISGIQIIKMYAWEKPFTQLINESRREEMEKIYFVSIIRHIMGSFLVFHWRIAFFCSIFFFVITGNMISAQKAFVTVAYFKVLRDSMTSYFPLAILNRAELFEALKRLQSFLLCHFNSDELSKSVEQRQQKSQKRSLRKVADHAENGELELLNNSADGFYSYELSSAEFGEFSIRMKNFSAKWEESISENCLKGISVDIERNALTAIIGPVGAGKSALVLAILKELTPASGCIEVSGTISYASQKPWLFSGSIKQNILFGQSWNEERYQQVIDVCALTDDFNQLPSGDITIVGERGSMLSIGQRARVSLARSIYREADIYLFDDPLSSVDVRVGKHIFEKCFKNFLKNKTCIFVTHDLQYLNNVDSIIFLEQGSLLGFGSYKELLDNGLQFDSFLDSKVNDEPGNESFDNADQCCEKVPGTAQNLTSPKQNHVTENARKMEEQIVKGTVGLGIYRAYFNGGKLAWILLVIFLFLLTQIFASCIDLWIAYWVNLENRNRLCQNNINTSKNEVCSSWENSAFYRSPEWGVNIFSILTGGTVLISLLRTFAFVKFCYNASLNLHEAMFRGIVHAPINFFNVNPAGRILNRFSKDLAAVDEYLPEFLLKFLQSVLPLISIICIVALVNPYILVPTGLMAFLFFSLYNFYLATSRDIRRIESVARSSVYSHFHTSLQGLISIRAFGAERILGEEFHRHMDVYSSASYLYIAIGRAFGLWCDMIGLFYIALIAFGLILQLENTSEGSVGLVITQTLFLIGSLQWCLRQKSELENQMTSVERIKEYCDVPQEEHSKFCVDEKPPANWPVKGEIAFVNVSLRYEAGEWKILKNLNFTVEAGEKVGIVGRTGAGKSSLVAALFRFAEIEGEIEIDGVDISTLGLNVLRKNISVIPQEPVLFSGTIRTNLDPFDEYSDSDLWNALQEVQLNVFKDLTEGLNSEVSDGGLNFSVGQRQLICLARAIIRNNKILILDEATANVDSQTDSLIQTVIREKFKNCTVLTIAHRLITVMDSDRILVMDSGVCVEFDEPFQLLQNENGVFSRMVSNTGRTMSETLHNLAYQKNIQRVNDKLPFMDE